MSKKIIGVTVGSPLPKPDFLQNDPAKGDYIKNRPDYEGLEATVKELGELVGESKVSDQISDAIKAIGHPVDSVNGKTGEVVLTAADVGANKVEASETNGNIKIDGEEVTVYTHPEKHAIADVTGLQDALDGMKTAGDYAAKEHAHTKDEITDFAHNHEMSEVNGLVSALAGKEAAGEAAKIQATLETYQGTNDAAVAKIADDLAAEAEAARAAEKANADAIADINHAETGILKQAKDYADGKDAAIQAAQKAGDDAQADVDALAGKVGEVPEDKTVVQMIADAQAAATYDDTQVKADIVANASAIELLTNGVRADEVDGVNDLIKYVKDHGTEVTGMKADINANSDAVAAEKTRAEGIEAGLDTRLKALEAIDHEHANKDLLDTYTQTEADLADAVAKKHEHANAVELAKFVDGDKAKLDSAVQTVTAAADSGLKATRTGNDIAIAIDDSITFVFDCGTSAV